MGGHRCNGGQLRFARAMGVCYPPENGFGERDGGSAAALGGG